MDSLSVKLKFVVYFIINPRLNRGFPGGAVVKNLPANVEDRRDLGLTPWEDSLEKETATHSWEI